MGACSTCDVKERDFSCHHDFVQRFLQDFHFRQVTAVSAIKHPFGLIVTQCLPLPGPLLPKETIAIEEIELISDRTIVYLPPRRKTPLKQLIFSILFYDLSPSLAD